MANIFQRFKIAGYEKKLKVAERKSFYKEEAVSIGPMTRVARAYQEGQMWQTVCQAYEVILRYHDYSGAYYYLGMALTRIGELDLGLRYLRESLTTSLQSTDSVDPKFAEDYLEVSHQNNRMDQARSFFKQLGDKEPKARPMIKSLQYQGKL